MKDAELIGRRYVRMLAPQLVFSKQFGKIDPTEDIIKKLEDEAAELSEAATSAGERAAIEKELRLESRAITAVIRRLHNRQGTEVSHLNGLGNVEKFGRGSRKVANSVFLGNIVISSLPDPMRIVMEEGLLRTMGPLVRGLTNGFKEIRIGAEQARLGSVGLDVGLASRARAISEPGNPAEFNLGPVASAVDKLQEKVFLFSGINHWNAFFSSFSSTVGGTRALQTMAKIADEGKVSRNDQVRLTRSGISNEMAIRIADQRKHWQKEGGSLFANIEAWDDQEAADAFMNAMIADSSRTIIRPGAGDLPVWMDNEYTSMISHLKTFAFASVSKMLLSGMDQPSIRVMNGLLLSVAMGAASVYIKDEISGRDSRARDTRG